MTFGNQLDIPSDVPLGSRIAAVYLAASGKYFGYFPTSGDNVQKVDLTSPSGSPSSSDALPSSNAINWSSIDGSNVVGVRLAEANVVAGSYSAHLLVGATKADMTLHVAEIDSNGNLNEVANGSLVGFPIQFDVGVINGEIFVVSAEGSAGMSVYKFTPPSSLTFAGSMSGTFYRALLRGPAPFPALLTHKWIANGESYVDIHDTKWITEGGSPIRAAHLRQEGSTSPPYKGKGFEALVQQTGSTVTAYVYREVQGYPLFSLHTDKIDISCIAADPNAPPIPFALMSNLSSVARGDGLNFYGDKWQLQDASVSYAPVTELDWDFHYTGTFGAEKIVTGANVGGSGFNPAYWPCDNLAGGDITTGNGCLQSLGTLTQSYQLGLQAKNVNGPGASPYVSTALTVLSPQISIVGFNGTVLQVLTGGTADARGSQGNTAEATFSWTFTPGGGATGLNPPVPAAATSFSVQATYKGGYTTSKSGAVQQVDLVPNFSLAPNPVLKGATLNLRNLMQIGAAATLVSVDYAITQGGGSGPLAATFYPPNGTANVTVPDSVGNFSIALTWNYTVSGVPKTASLSLPFTTTNFTPVPALGIYKAADHSQQVFPLGNPITYSLQQGTTYYLFDDEGLPGGLSHPGASFWKSGDSNQSISGGDTELTGSPTAGYGPATFAASTACSGNCYFKVQVPATGGTIRAFRYSVGTSGPPPPPPPPTTSVSLAAPSPASPQAGETVTFTAVPVGFTGTVSYLWSFGDSVAPVFLAGPNPTTHVYGGAGIYTVTVQANGGGATRIASQTVVVADAGPPPPPSPGYAITGATLGSDGRWEAPMGQTVTFTASEANAASWGWSFGDDASASGRVVTHAYSALGPHDVVLTVNGDAVNTSGSSSATIGFTVFDPTVLSLGDHRFEVRASWTSVSQGKNGVGTAVSLTSDTGYFWFFSPSNIEVVVKVLDACSVDPEHYFWVFGGGLTNLGVELTVTDTITGATKTYSNPEGTPFAPIQDTRFESCPASPASAAPAVRSLAATTATVTLAAPDPANPAVGDSVQFTATSDLPSPVMYRWDFGDSQCSDETPNCGGLNVGPNPNTHVFTVAGTYTVTVKASSGGTSATATQSVTVSPASTIPHPSTAYTVSGASPGAGSKWYATVAQEITLTASETHAASWDWDFGNGETATGQTVTHTFANAGSFPVTLKVTGDGTNTEGTSSAVIRFSITDPYTLYLDGGRFAVNLAWSSSAGTGSNGLGTATDLTDDTGYFWFFSPTNTEVVVKVLDACGYDGNGGGHFWVFASGLTNLGVTLTVTDTSTQQVVEYTSADGTPFQPIQDVTSFASCGAH